MLGGGAEPRESQFPIVILGVITIVVFGAADTIQRQDLRRNAIEKIAIVTDRDDRSFIR